MHRFYTDSQQKQKLATHPWMGCPSVIGAKSPKHLLSGNARKRLLKGITSLIILLLSVSEIHGQQATDYTVQANIIYRFTKYIDWPDNRKSGDFIIGVVGETPLYDELKEFIANKSTGDQKIIIKRFASSATAFNCHILFIDESESRSVKKIAAVTTGKPILIVSESEGLASKGSCINFVIVDDHLKLEINKNTIEGRDLNIASELLQLGKLIK